MLSKFLKEVVVILVGKQSEPIADLLDSKKHVNEFLIAKKLGLKNITFLPYLLDDERLVKIKTHNRHI